MLHYQADPRMTPKTQSAVFVEHYPYLSLVPQESVFPRPARTADLNTGSCSLICAMAEDLKMKFEIKLKYEWDISYALTASLVTSVVGRLWSIIYPVSGSFLGFPVVAFFISGASSVPILLEIITLKIMETRMRIVHKTLIFMRLRSFLPLQYYCCFGHFSHSKLS